MWVAVVALTVAALVALALARRFTRPLVAAVTATGRIAGGDLSARVPVARGDEREFRKLAEAINTMGDDLARAREQERQFLLSVSHEFRTPLTSIRGYADAVVEGATGDAVGAASIISSESRRLERLVQDLLDLARLDADRFSLDLAPVDAAGVARTVVDGFTPGRLSWAWRSGPSATPGWWPGRTVRRRVRGPCGSPPTRTASARWWPTWWRTPRTSPPGTSR